MREHVLDIDGPWLVVTSLFLVFGFAFFGTLLICRLSAAIAGIAKLSAYGIFYLIIPEFPKRAYDALPFVLAATFIQVLPIVFWYDGISLGMASSYFPYPAQIQGTPSVRPRHSDQPGTGSDILVTYFYDGAMCERYEDTWRDASRSSPDVIQARDPRDSNKFVDVKIRRNPAGAGRGLAEPWGKACVATVPGSTQGRLATWRSLAGWYLNYNWISWTIGILVFFIFTYVVLVCVLAPFAIWRGGAIVARALLVPHSSRWQPAAVCDTPLLVQVSDIHLTCADQPYEIKQQPSLWRGPMNTIERSGWLLEAIHRLDRPNMLLMTGDLTDIGSTQEWAAFGGLMHRFRNDDWGLLLMAGNHDVSINVHWAPDPFRSKRQERERSCLDAMRQFDDPRCWGGRPPTASVCQNEVVADLIQGSRP